MILTWSSPPLSFLAPEHLSWARLPFDHPPEEPVPPVLALLVLALAVVEAELVLLFYRIRQMLK
ncbi:MAG TPA: hypothetical protein VHV54_14725 [Candidatus Binatia bacterium]|nr:hypothetical protein [Candidatus Binatia bacterium]